MNGFADHIPQPPHSTGHPFHGLRARIDPEQIPSPVDAARADEEVWRGKTYLTLPGNNVPLSTTDFISVDQGNSTPRFIRMSTWNIPSTSSLANSCQIPVVAVVQPFAEQHPLEEEIPVVDFGETGPARCAECRAYINPWCTFVNGGTKWKCNLCGHATDVLPEYFCNLDANLMRLDHLQRPELNKGTVDFIVPETYWAPHPLPRLTPSFYSPEPPPISPTRPPRPMKFLFILDVTFDAVRLGFTKAACIALSAALYGCVTESGKTLLPCVPQGSQIAIMTYDETLHFHDLSPAQEHSRMLVLPDLEDVFCPMREEFYMDPLESKTVIDQLLEAIPERFESNRAKFSAFGAALRGGLASLTRQGGHIISFINTLPTLGPGALNTRLEEMKLYDTDKEKSLFLPQDRFWRDIAEECAEEGIGVSMIIANGQNTFIDVASLGVVASMTGGSIYFHPRFDPSRDSSRVRSQLRYVISRQTVFNCSLRVRCSNGLRVSAYRGNFHQRSADDMELGIFHSDQAFTVSLDYTRSLDERGYAFLQCAVLYTTVDGQRRLRTINLAVQVAGLAGNVFRYADVDATVCHLAKEAVTSMMSTKLAEIRETLTERCSKILLGYRRNCAMSTAPSQLILPEAFKILPIYILGLQKDKSIRGFNVTADIRNYHAHRLLSMGVRDILVHLYPRLVSLHNMPEDVAIPVPETGSIRLPPQIRSTHMCMQAHGVYLIDNGEFVIIWVGATVTQQLLLDLFGVDSIHRIDARMPYLASFSTHISNQVHNILSRKESDRRGLGFKFFVARQNLDAAEIEFSDMLVEDRNCGAMSYIDYLCFVHKQINVAVREWLSLQSIYPNTSDS